jgi:hypothetical protein
MEQHASVVIAGKMKEIARQIWEVLDYVNNNVELTKRRAPFSRAIEDMLATVTDEIYARLVTINPGLHEVLYPGLPKDGPHRLVQVSILPSSPERSNNPRTVFLLWHSRDLGDGETDDKLIGVYSSKAEAEAAKRRKMQYAGFRDVPEGFLIDQYTVDRDQWSEGYITG